MTWVKISDRHPSKDECNKYWGWFTVLRKYPEGSFPDRPDISRYDGHDEDYSFTHKWKYHWDEYITHWMPLPDLPKEKDEKNNTYNSNDWYDFVPISSNEETQAQES